MDDKDAVAKKNQFDGSLLFDIDDFNRKTGREAHIEEATRLQTGYFIDPTTRLLYEHMAEIRRCPICDSDETRLLFIKDGFKHVKCKCGFIFVNPTADDKFREYFFSEVYQTWTKVLLSPEQELVDNRKFQYGLELIEKHIDRRGFLVDIGAGPGLFLKIASDAGWKGSAIEFNRKAVENIKRLGIEVCDRPLEDGIYSPDSIDAVTLWEVLEHLNYPNEIIIQVKRILKPKGLLFICVPNINALVTRILHEKSRTFGGSVHVNFFSIETLSRLVEKNNFEILEVETAITELGTLKNHLSFEEPYNGRADLDLNFLTPEYLYKNNLGSRILILCRKI